MLLLKRMFQTTRGAVMEPGDWRGLHELYEDAAPHLVKRVERETWVGPMVQAIIENNPELWQLLKVSGLVGCNERHQTIQASMLKLLAFGFAL